MHTCTYIVFISLNCIMGEFLIIFQVIKSLTIDNLEFILTNGCIFFISRILSSPLPHLFIELCFCFVTSCSFFLIPLFFEYHKHIFFKVIFKLVSFGVKSTPIFLKNFACILEFWLVHSSRVGNFNFFSLLLTTMVLSLLCVALLFLIFAPKITRT